MVFDKEASFEEAVITVLKQHGWDDAGGVLRYPTEQDLIDNWAKILFQNNAAHICNSFSMFCRNMGQFRFDTVECIRACTKQTNNI